MVKLSRIRSLGRTKTATRRRSTATARRRGPAPGIGDRVLARLSFTGDDTYDARAIKFLGPDMRQLLGVFERDDRGKGILRPADRRQKYPYPVAGPRGWRPIRRICRG